MNTLELEALGLDPDAFLGKTLWSASDGMHGASTCYSAQQLNAYPVPVDEEMLEKGLDLSECCEFSAVAPELRGLAESIEDLLRDMKAMESGRSEFDTVAGMAPRLLAAMHSTLTIRRWSGTPLPEGHPKVVAAWRSFAEDMLSHKGLSSEEYVTGSSVCVVKTRFNNFLRLKGDNVPRLVQCWDTKAPGNEMVLRAPRAALELVTASLEIPSGDIVTLESSDTDTVVATALALHEDGGKYESLLAAFSAARALYASTLV